MQNDWIIDVLADVKTFARANGLPMLAAQLEETAFVAAAELSAQSEGAGRNGCREQAEAGFNLGKIGSSYRA
jgi:hypothetical protein